MQQIIETRITELQAEYKKRGGASGCLGAGNCHGEIIDAEDQWGFTGVGGVEGGGGRRQ
ncbi:MAG: hypothetical protein IPO07_23115 [Haliscomenobacter sp.]|nr:hypothetical protein [Haliscomenobacter sp.]MBK9491359.1 hypothetical protein [Haliscomenobacter sp.]